MRILKDKFKRSLKFIFKLYKKRSMRHQILTNLKYDSRNYNFNTKDIDLYLHEKFIKLPNYKIHETSEPGIINITINGISIFWPSRLLHHDLPWLYHEIFDDFTLNPSSYDHPKFSANKKSWVIDAGAFEGYFSIFSHKWSPDHLICVEPLTIMKYSLEKTLSKYFDKKINNFSIVNAALSDKLGIANICINFDHACDSKIFNNDALHLANDINLNDENTIQTVTIDQLVDNYSLNFNGLIKMDIEGAEMNALNGEIVSMRTYKPALAIAVYHNYENAMKCSEIIRSANPSYQIEYRGYYGYFSPPRPYMIFAY